MIESAIKVTTKREEPKAMLFMVGKRAYAVRLTPKRQMAAADITALLYDGRKNRDE